MKNMVAADFFVVPRVFFELLFLFVILSHDLSLAKILSTPKMARFSLPTVWKV